MSQLCVCLFVDLNELGSTTELSAQLLTLEEEVSRSAQPHVTDE